MTVPNTTLTDEPIERPFGRPRHRLHHDVGVADDADLAAALGHISAVPVTSESVADDPSPRVYATDLASDWVTCRVHF